MSDHKLEGLKIMVVDDSNTIRKSAEVFLKQAGCRVVLSENGYEALAQIKSVQPDLIFMDIMMPRLDGYQTCMLLKANSNYKGTPVIMLSSKDGLFDQARGQLAGANEYMTKPFTREELLKVVETHLMGSAA